MEKDVEKLLKNLKANQNKRVRSAIDAQTYLNHVNKKTKLDQVSQLQKEIEKDFGIKIKDDFDQVEANAFDEVEKQLNQQIFGQEKFLHQLILGFKRPFVMEKEKEQPLNHLLVVGKKGSGKHTSLEQLLRLSFQKKIFSNASKVVIDFNKIQEEKLFYQDFYEASQSQASIVVFDHLECCPKTLNPVIKEFVSTGILQLNKRYAVQKKQLVEANQMLLSQSVSQLTLNNKYCIYISNQSLQSLSNDFGLPFIQSFQDICVTEELSEKARKAIVQKECSLFVQNINQQLNLDLHLEDTLIHHFEQQSTENFESLLTQIKEALITFKLKQELKYSHLILSYDSAVFVEYEQVRYHLFEYIGSPLIDEIFEVKKELESIVGLQEVKNYILSLEQNVKNQQRRLKQGLKAVDVSMHMIFTGNPGTGKTTIARLISRYLKTMGVVQGGQLVEVTRADCVGQYVGHTAPLMSKIIESARGGILFIDEAYSLYRGKEDSFGLEAIDTLVKAMEDYRDQLIVILAGYSKEMEEFLEANSGLKSRFPNLIHFDDYTAEELVAITQSIAQEKDYVIHEECLEPLRVFYAQKQKENARENGNGRMARNCVESAILKQASRSLNDPSARIDELRKEDFNF